MFCDEHLFWIWRFCLDERNRNTAAAEYFINTTEQAAVVSVSIQSGFARGKTPFVWNEAWEAQISLSPNSHFLLFCLIVLSLS